MAPKQKKHQKSQEAAAAGAGILQLNRKENWTQLHIVLASWGVLPSKERKVVLESGDILVFGGLSRLVYHGTRNVQHGT
ncbi:unnamed protein product [Sphagnum jensenii]|uniref:Alpha-ketoglutarate-dependent dioxygenase AlkB-like domain-containing protein n=1 Tax=Sphagnum jensenii TaxID=128206 RepID=A0ABP0WZ87_9BRYO